MRAPLLRRAGAAAAVAGAAAVALTASAGGATNHPAITPKGVGPIKIGATAASLQAKGLITKLTKGCELAGPNTRSAGIKTFNGTVGFTRSTPRRVNVISVNGEGPQARGVGLGDRLADIRKAYKVVKVDKRQRGTFGGDFVTIPKKAGGKIMFFIDKGTHTITQIGVPIIPVCE
jgi:hypothetical protein